MITSSPSLNCTILDLASLVANPPHHTNWSRTGLEWAGRAIPDRVYDWELNYIHFHHSNYPKHIDSTLSDPQT